MLRIGVVGAGVHSSSNHGPALRRCKEERPEAVELAAVCDLDAARAVAYAARFGFGRTYTDLDAMLVAEDLDGVVVVTPIEATGRLAAHIARTGTPLAVEKPPGATLEEARWLQDALLKTATPHMVSFNRRFSPALVRARQWLIDKPRPQLVASRMLRHNRRENDFVFGTGIHSVDTVLSLMGAPRRVTAQQYPVSVEETPFFDARVEFVEGGVATFVFAPACGRVEESVEIIGDGYNIRVDMGGCAVEIDEGGAPALSWQVSDGAEEWERNGALDETRFFIRCLQGAEAWGPGLEEAFWSVWTAAAIQRGGEATP